MPTMSILNFREENFRDQKSNHEIHENIVPRKFGAIWYCGIFERCENGSVFTLERLQYGNEMLTFYWLLLYDGNNVRFV